MNKFDLALVTGATSGIGKAVASLLEQKNIEVIGLGSADGDLSTSSGREQVLQIVREKQPDLIINSAGLGVYGNAIELSIEEQLQIVHVNVQALLEITLEGARALRAANKEGVIVNVSSMAGEIPTPGMSVYGASKAFVTKFSQGLDFELKETGIRVLTSCPGMVATEFASRAAKKKVNVKRCLTPEEVASKIWLQIKKGKQTTHFPFLYHLILRAIYRSTIKRI